MTLTLERFCRRRVRVARGPGAGRPADHTEDRGDQQQKVVAVSPAKTAAQEPSPSSQQRPGTELHAAHVRLLRR